MQRPRWFEWFLRTFLLWNTCKVWASCPGKNLRGTLQGISRRANAQKNTPYLGDVAETGDVLVGVVVECDVKPRKWTTDSERGHSAESIHGSESMV